MPGLVPMFFFVGARAYLQAAGRVQPLFVATVAGNVFNLVADLIFVFGGATLPSWTGPLRHVPAMGAAGAGLATSLAMLVQGTILGYSAWAHAGPGASRTRRLPRLSDLQKAAQVGLPVGLQMGAEVGVFALAGLLAGRFGAEALAAHQVALALASLTFCVAIGIGSAGSVRVGLAIGRGETEGVRRSGMVAFALGATVMSVFAIAFFLAPGGIARLLTDRPEVLATAIPLLGVVAVFQISDGAQGIGAGILRGAGDTLFAFLANLVGHYLVGLPLAIWLGIALHQGVVGLWWGLCAGLTSVALGLFTRFWRLSSRPIERLEHGAPG
jgi:multidrug resistance protein, MATE family